MTTTARDLVEIGARTESAFVAKHVFGRLPVWDEMSEQGRAGMRECFRDALIATFRKLAEDGPTEAMLATLARYHPVERDEAIEDHRRIMRALARELEELTP